MRDILIPRHECHSESCLYFVSEMEPLTKEEIPILATACATGDSVHVTSDEMQDGVSTANMPLNQLLDQDKNVAGVTNSCYSEVPSQSRSENGQTNVPIKVPIIAPSPGL